MLGFKIKRQTKQQKKPEKALPEDQAKLKQWQEGVVRLKDILAPAAFSVSTKYVEIDGKFATTLFVTAYPRYLETNWLSPIVNFDVEFDLGMFVYPQDSATILRQLKKQSQLN